MTGESGQKQPRRLGSPELTVITKSVRPSSGQLLLTYNRTLPDSEPPHPSALQSREPRAHSSSSSLLVCNTGDSLAAALTACTLVAAETHEMKFMKQVKYTSTVSDNNSVSLLEPTII